MDGKEQKLLNQDEHTDLILKEYWKVLKGDIRDLSKKATNANVRTGYLNVLKAINTHEKRWSRQFESIESDNAQLAEKEQLQKA